MQCSWVCDYSKRIRDRKCCACHFKWQCFGYALSLFTWCCCRLVTLHFWIPAFKTLLRVKYAFDFIHVHVLFRDKNGCLKKSEVEKFHWNVLHISDQFSSEKSHSIPYKWQSLKSTYRFDMFAGVQVWFWLMMCYGGVFGLDWIRTDRIGFHRSLHTSSHGHVLVCAYVYVLIFTDRW